MHSGREPSNPHFEHAVVKQVADSSSTSQLDLASCVVAFGKPLELISGSESNVTHDQVHAQSECSNATLANDRTIHSDVAFRHLSDVNTLPRNG